MSNVLKHLRRRLHCLNHVRAGACVMLAVAFICSGAARAGGDDAAYSAQLLRGTWIWSGMLQFGAPIPLPGTLVDGTPPHAAVAPGDVVGLSVSTVGLMSFDGHGNVTHADEVVKIGGIVPAAGLPFEHLPPFPEVYTGVYDVGPTGVVAVQLSGRSPESPEGQVDFEYDLHCVLNRWPREMTCVPARFKTYVLDPDGYPAPITGIVEIKRRY